MCDGFLPYIKPSAAACCAVVRSWPPSNLPHSDRIRVSGIALVMADRQESLARTASPLSGQGSFDEKAEYTPTSEKPDALYTAGTLEKQASHEASTGEWLSLQYLLRLTSHVVQ